MSEPRAAVPSGLTSEERARREDGAFERPRGERENTALDHALDGYPDAARLDLTEDLSGHEVSDPYRWLEDAASPQTEGWLRSQDELFGQHGSGLPGADRLAARILELTGTGHVGVPGWRGGRRV